MSAVWTEAATRRPASLTVDVCCGRARNFEGCVRGGNDFRDLGVHVRATCRGGQSAIRGEVRATGWQLHAALDAPIAHSAKTLTLNGRYMRR